MKGRSIVSLALAVLAFGFSPLAAAPQPGRLQAELDNLRNDEKTASEKFCLCHSTPNGVCLNCRFGVVASWLNPFDGSSGIAGAKLLTPASGYFYFTDPTNVEVPVKILDACGNTPPGWWFLAAGLTDLGVTILSEDFLTGIQKQYENSPGQLFTTIIDQNTPWPCP
jgi:hypothetical protein